MKITMTWGNLQIALRDEQGNYRPVAATPDGTQHTDIDGEWHKTSRRIAACWNKFDGLPIEAIESMPGTVMEMAATMDHANETLLNLLQRLIADPSDTGARLTAEAILHAHGRLKPSSVH